MNYFRTIWIVQLTCNYHCESVFMHYWIKSKQQMPKMDDDNNENKNKNANENHWGSLTLTLPNLNSGSWIRFYDSSYTEEETERLKGGQS